MIRVSVEWDSASFTVFSIFATNHTLLHIYLFILVKATQQHATSPAALKGRELYRRFSRTIRLTQVMRQQGEDDTSIKFRDALSQLRVGQLTKERWELLCSRVRNELSPEEVASFDTALRLYYTTNAEVNETNFAHLSALNKPVKKVKAQNRPFGLPRPFCPVLVPQRHTSKIPLRNSRIICFIVVTMITHTR